MANSHLGAVWLINESSVVFRSSVTSSFRNKRFRRLAEGWRFPVQEMLGTDQTTKRHLIHLVKRSESLSWILDKHRISADNPEAAASNESRRRAADLICEEQLPHIPSSSIAVSQMSAAEHSPGPSVEENQWETLSTSDNLLDQKMYNFTQLNTGALFVLLLPMLGFCIVCMLGAFRGRNSENSAKKSRDHHQGPKRTRWKHVLNEPKEPQAATEPDPWPDCRVTSGDDEAPVEISQAYGRVERDYQRFLSECGISEHGYWRGGSS